MPADPLEALFIGGLGYLLGRGQFAGWENMINAYNERLNHLQYFKVIKPAKVFEDAAELQSIHRQAVLSYLQGLPDASVAMSLRCLEVTLKQAKTKLEGQEAKENLSNLIDWAGNYLGAKKDLAHGFRILRNLIHERTLVKEQDALEAIRHTTEIINLMYPFNTVQMAHACPKCGMSSTYQIRKDDYYIGNTLNVGCGSCQQTSPLTVF